MNTYLKTYFYSDHEYEFLNANLRESVGHIDSMILCEFDVHHTGIKRDFTFDINMIDEDLRDRVEYFPCGVHGKETVEAYDDEDTIHRVNEPVMRSYFTKCKDFSDDDLIYSVDADEVIYGSVYETIHDLAIQHDWVRLPMHQFFYKTNYLWENKGFCSPGVFKYGSVNPGYMNNWRDVGINPGFFTGCHFSWCMSVDDMVKKLHSYSHPRYRFCADKSLLEMAIRNKCYPFDLSVKFNILEISPGDDRIPESMRI